MRTHTDAVADWNKRHPPGTAVVVHRDDGTMLHTTTRSTAWLVGGIEPVVSVVGISGGYSLYRVAAKET